MKGKKLIAMLLCCMMLFNTFFSNVYATETEETMENTEEIVETESSCGEGLTWSAEGGILRISGNGEIYDYTADAALPWNDYLGVIEEIVIDAGVTRIGDYAFNNFASLTSIKFLGDAPSFGNHCFYGKWIINAYYPENNDTWTGENIENGDTTLVMEAYCVREFADAGVVTEPTCTENGFTTYTCTVCGESYTDNETEATGHTYDEGVITEPSCAADGFTTYTCTVCGESYTDHVVDSLEHTCTYTALNDGTHGFVCSVCGYEGTESCKDEDGDIICDLCNVRVILALGDCGESLAWTLYGEYVLTFEGEGSMTSYTSETAVPWQAYAANIVEIQFPENLTAIGAYAFSNFTSLQTMTIPETVTSIGMHAFYNCAGFSGVLEISENVNYIGEQAFGGSSMIETLCFKGNVPPYINTDVSTTEQNAESIQKTLSKDNLPNLKEIIVPAEGYSAYTYAYGAGIPEDVKLTVDTEEEFLVKEDIYIAYLGNEAVVTIPEGITKIANHAFYRNANVQEIILPESVTTIGSYAFYHCSNLNEMTLGENISSIGNYAFDTCTITSLTVEGNVSSIGANALYNTGITQLHIGETVTSISGVFTNVNTLQAISVDENNLYYSSVDGVLFSYDDTILERYPMGKTGESYEIPENIMTIARSAFEGNTYLCDITIPVNMTSVGTNAFMGCTSLMNVYYKGSELQWRLINVNTGNNWFVGATVYCNDQREEGENKSGWDGTVATEFGGGTGTAGDPYLIRHATDLAYLAQKIDEGNTYSGQYFMMTNDIDMNYTYDWHEWSETYVPRNVWDTPEGNFSGVFDGNNYAIVGLYSNEGGLFGSGYQCTIQNLGIKESYVCGDSSVGAIMDSAHWYCNFINCYNAGNVKGSNYVGGIVGNPWWGINIENCYNIGEIYGEEYVGGIVGCINLNSNITKCVNIGKVKGNFRVGGISGWCVESDIEKCINQGDISGNSYIGGIAGVLQGEDHVDARANECENYGKIAGKTRCIGGIVGYAYPAFYADVYVDKAANFGKVEGNEDIGGIVGFGTGTVVEGFSVTNSYNVAEISGIKYVGGIAGRISCSSSYGKATGCYNMGNIFASGISDSITPKYWSTGNYYAENCYYLDTCGSSTAEYATALTSAEMLLQSSYEGFDFENVWIMDSNLGRPVLRISDLPTNPETNEHFGAWNSEVDDYIIEEVKKYTSDEQYAQFDVIMSSNYSADVKLDKLNSLFENYGITDVREGIDYLSETTSYRHSYLHLTTNEIYCAYNFYNWLNTTKSGQAARGLLWADGLIFNFELGSYFHPSTYTESEYPGVKKNKEMLRTFMETSENNGSEVLDTTNKLADFLDSLLDLNGQNEEETLDALMQKILDSKSEAETDMYQMQFAEKLVSAVNNNGSDVIRMDSEKVAEATGYSADILEFVGATAEDINDIINLHKDIALYQKYNRFLTNIYENTGVSWEMRMAAWSLLDDIDNGYWHNLQGLLDNLLVLETGVVPKLVLDKSAMEVMFEEFGVATFGGLLDQALGVISVSAFISNLVIDMGETVTEAAYTQGYAELSVLYSLILEEDKQRFLDDPSAENAWTFFEDYTVLWNLRKLGEESYLQMNELKMLAFVTVKNHGYSAKEAVVKDNLAQLEKSRFTVASEYTIPASVAYAKKAVVNCPVDVYVYTDSGELVAVLKDGVESDVTNAYGRFAVVKQSYTGEYAKVICQSTSEHLNYEVVAVSGGLVDYEVYDGETIQTFDKLLVDTDSVINVTADGYSVDSDADGVADTTGSYVEKDTEEYIKVESIELTESAITLDCGQSKVIGVTVLPANASNTVVDWRSLDEDVAIVQNGVITALSGGETTIYATAVDGEEIEIKITVTVKETPVLEAFDDLVENAWYLDAVQYVYNRNLMSGSNGSFNPTKPITRAQVVTTLYRMEGSPEVTDYRACDELVDVEADQWYTDAVCWAYNTGVGTGNSSTKMFNVNTPVTRQQLALFFYRYAENKEFDITASGDISTMLNAEQVADYAEEAVKWAVGIGIISGSATTDAEGNPARDLAPQSNATRAQMAAILQRFCETYNVK